MALDLRTLMVFIAAEHLLFALLMLSYWRQRHADRALAIWSISNWAGAAGWLLISLRDLAPAWLSISAGNSLLLLTWMLLWAGMRSFSTRRRNWAAVVLPPLIVFVLFQFVPQVKENLVARIVVVNLGLMLALLAVGLDAVRDERRNPLHARRIVFFSLLAIVIANLARTALSLGLDPYSNLLSPNRTQELCIFAQGLAVVAWNIGILLMERERLENDLTRAARRDAMTGMLNRAGFRELGDRQIQRSAREQRPVSVMLMDLDRFKAINDSYGHAAGDRLLCAFAECAHAVVRPTDLLARYGGEEFSMLLPDTDLAQAERIAERLRARFAEVRIEKNAKQVGTTVSIGIAQVHLERETVERALGRADIALYRAKGQGRNRVLSCTE